MTQMQGDMDAQPEAFWQQSASQRLGVRDPDRYSHLGSMGMAQAPEPMSLRERSLQAMRDSWIGQTPGGRAYIGVVDFATGLPGQLFDTARGLAYIASPKGKWEMATGLVDEVRQHGVSGVLVNGVRGFNDAAQATYNQAYFGTEEDRVKLVLEVGSQVLGGKALGRIGGVANTQLASDLNRIGADGHAIARHGGAVTDSQLMSRSLTGYAPDGSVKLNPKTKQPILPPMSTAFYSDDALAYADNALRQNYLEQAVALSPNQNVIRLNGVDLGFGLGRGYARIGSSSYNPGLQGPLHRIDGLQRVDAVYKWSPVENRWLTDTIFPTK